MIRPIRPNHASVHRESHSITRGGLPGHSGQQLGQGRPYLANVSSDMNRIVGGWSIDGVATFQRGFPLVFSNGQANDVTLFAAGSRPDLLPQRHKSRPESDDSRLGGWFNTACFSVPADFTFGSEHRFGNQSTPAPVCIEILLLIWKRSSTRFRSSLLSIGEPTDAAPEKTYRLSRPFHRAH